MTFDGIHPVLTGFDPIEAEPVFTGTFNLHLTTLLNCCSDRLVIIKGTRPISLFFHIVIMLLNDISPQDLKQMSLNMWNTPVDLQNGGSYLVEIIGSIKNVDDVSVCFFFSFRTLP